MSCERASCIIQLFPVAYASRRRVHRGSVLLGTERHSQPAMHYLYAAPKLWERFRPVKKRNTEKAWLQKLPGNGSRSSR